MKKLVHYFTLGFACFLSISCQKDSPAIQLETENFAKKHLVGISADITSLSRQEYDDRIDLGPFVKTHWGQCYPYNSKVPNNYYLGCVTIATAQLMKYYQIPTWGNWEDMPSDTSNDTLSKQVTSR